MQQYKHDKHNRWKHTKYNTNTHELYIYLSIYVQGVPEKNSAESAAPHFCNRTSQSRAVFNKMSRSRLFTQQRPTDECKS